MVAAKSYDPNSLKPHDHFSHRDLERYVRCVETQRKAKVDNARQSRGIFFIEPDDEEF